MKLERHAAALSFAAAAVFLASPHASYLTGVTLDVNGGAWMN